MSSVRKPRSHAQRTAADWPPTAEIDGFRWEVGPGPEDLQWAAENLNESWDAVEPTPDHVIDGQAAEAEAQARYENGLLF